MFFNIYTLNVFCIVFIDLRYYIYLYLKVFLMLSHSDIFDESKICTIKVLVISQTLTPDHFHFDRFRSEDVYPVRQHVWGQLCSGTSGAN